MSSVAVEREQPVSSEIFVISASDFIFRAGWRSGTFEMEDVLKYQRLQVGVVCWHVLAVC